MSEFTQELIINFAYLLASVLFILGLRSLNHPDSARRGMNLAAAGMTAAIIGTFFHWEITDFTGILIGLTVGSILGALIAIFTPMTAMPERTALSHAFGAIAVTMVGVAKYYEFGAELGHIKMAAIGFEVMFGALTITGSFMAVLKLQGIVPGTPLVYKGQNLVNFTTFFVIVGMFIYLQVDPGNQTVFYAMVVLSTLFGLMLVLPIGAADMPVVISLLNSYAGLAACATGFALNNTILIIAGALDGASGFILSIIMCRAMNRSITNVLFGAFGQAPEDDGAGAATGGTVKSMTVDDVSLIFENAQSLIIVPGYGMAVAHAQHAVRELADIMKKRGTTVKYAIHPVAGRMPGHMNVLLAEANVPYEDIQDLEQINDEFTNTDVCLIIGANDVTNPAARHTKSSPIYGMPILNCDKARTVIVVKRSMKPGFAGIDNELYTYPNTYMYFGDAKDAVGKLVGEMKMLAGHG